MEVLVADNLSRSFGQGPTRRAVLRNVSLRLYAGQFVVLMGPSGSGKSTLLALLSGLAKPDEGRVVALGQDLWQLTEHQRERFRRQHCGFIFQGYNLFPSLTAAEQLEMVLRWSEPVPTAEATRRVSEVMAELGIADKGHQLPPSLSGGEKQRVAIARALLKNPELCFADEPTAALDWTTGKQVCELLQMVSRKHNTMMFIVTHDVRILPFADRVLHLDEGKLQEDAPGFIGDLLE